MLKTGIYLWLILISLSVSAQPSVGLINTDITGPLGSGKRLMQYTDSIHKNTMDSTIYHPMFIDSTLTAKKTEIKKKSLYLKLKQALLSYFPKEN